MRAKLLADRAIIEQEPHRHEVRADEVLDERICTGHRRWGDGHGAVVGETKTVGSGATDGEGSDAASPDRISTNEAATQPRSPVAATISSQSFIRLRAVSSVLSRRTVMIG